MSRTGLRRMQVKQTKHGQLKWPSGSPFPCEATIAGPSMQLDDDDVPEKLPPVLWPNLQNITPSKFMHHLRIP